jgi:hypothetical protein
VRGSVEEQLHATEINDRALRELIAVEGVQARGGGGGLGEASAGLVGAAARRYLQPRAHFGLQDAHSVGGEAVDGVLPVRAADVGAGAEHVLGLDCLRAVWVRTGMAWYGMARFRRRSVSKE